jgi:hypothetical protein
MVLIQLLEGADKENRRVNCFLLMDMIEKGGLLYI